MMRLWKYRCKYKIFATIVIIFITMMLMIKNYITENDELDRYWEVVLKEYENEIPIVIVDEHQEGNVDTLHKKWSFPIKIS